MPDCQFAKVGRRPANQAGEGRLVVGPAGDGLLLDYAKLVEGSGLSIGKVRKPWCG